MQKEIHSEELFNLVIVSKNRERVEINLPVSLVKNIIQSTGKIPTLKLENDNKHNMLAMSQKVIGAIDRKYLGRVLMFTTSKGDTVNISINKSI